MIILWNKNIDAEFRISYQEIVNEVVQDTPTELSDIFFVGSSRITEQNMTDLKAIYGDSVIFQENYPK
jgi:hypothetical protein